MSRVSARRLHAAVLFTRRRLSFACSVSRLVRVSRVLFARVSARRSYIVVLFTRRRLSFARSVARLVRVSRVLFARMSTLRSYTVVLFRASSARYVTRVVRKLVCCFAHRKLTSLRISRANYISYLFDSC
jgi:hypothetical protein